MQNKYKLTKLQLFSILFLVPMVITLTYGKNFFKDNNKQIWDFTVSSIVSYIVTFLLMLPAYILYKKYPDLNLFTSCKLKKINSAIYGLYFIWAACYTVSIFRIFILSVAPHGSQIFLDTILMCILAIYASFKGINAISRTSVIIFALVFASIFIILFSLFKKIEWVNYPPIMQDGPHCAINGVLYMVSRNFAIPVLIVLFPITNVKSGKIALFWNTIIHLIFNIIIFVNTGSLGDFLGTQIFSIYAATKVAHIGVFKRLDTIYMGVFTTGILIITSLFLNIFNSSLGNVKKAGIKNTITASAIFAVLMFGCLLKGSKDFGYFIYDTKLLLILLFVTTLVLPTANLIAESTRESCHREEVGAK